MLTPQYWRILRSLKSFDFVQALQAPDGLRQPEALAMHLCLGGTCAMVKLSTQELPSMWDFLWKTLFQSITLFGQGVVCPKAPGRDREAVLVTPVGLLWWMLTLGITRLPLFPAHQQDWLSWETQTSINPSRWVFRHYLPVRAKACLAFMWKFKSWCQPAVLGAWSQGPIKHLLLSHAFILLLSSTKALQAPSVHRWHVSSQV